MKPTLFISLLFILLNIILVNGQTCDCTSFPVKPRECLITCLGTATVSQLQSGLKLDAETAKAVVNVPNRKSFKSLDDFKNVLTYASYQKLETVINNYYNTNNGQIYNNNHYGTGDIINGNKN